ncbi:MAG: response regulator [Flavobacterium sp.]|nr:response regulator [Flavobacterium sp.]
MNHDGPIIIIEDDEDDQEILKEIFDKIDNPNKVLFFSDAIKALDFLTSNEGTPPFLIISDMNLPQVGGLELRSILRKHENIGLRCVPYLFFTTSAGYRDLVAAYSDSVQGFFIKPSSMSELERLLQRILHYWKDNKPPVG